MPSSRAGDRGPSLVSLHMARPKQHTGSASFAASCIVRHVHGPRPVLRRKTMAGSSAGLGNTREMRGSCGEPGHRLNLWRRCGRGRGRDGDWDGRWRVYHAGARSRCLPSSSLLFVGVGIGIGIVFFSSGFQRRTPTHEISDHVRSKSNTLESQVLLLDRQEGESPVSLSKHTARLVPVLSPYPPIVAPSRLGIVSSWNRALGL